MITESQRKLIDFAIEREPLITKTTGKESELDLIWNQRDGKTCGVVKNNSYIIPHLQAVQQLEDVLSSKGITECDAHKFHLTKNGAHLFIHYKLPEDYTIDLGNDLTTDTPKNIRDTLVPEMILRNSYDTKFNLGIEWGLYRPVCTNGARILVIGNKVLRKLEGKIDQEVLMTGIKTFIDQVLQTIVARIKLMVTARGATLGFNLTDWVNKHFSTKTAVIFNTELKSACEEHNVKDWQDLSQWQLFNIATYVTTHYVRAYSRQRDLEYVVSRRFALQAR